MTIPTSHRAGLLLATLALGACSDSTLPATGRPVTLSFSAAPAATSASLVAWSPAASRSITVASGGHTLDITRVQLVLARVELQRAGATCAAAVAAGDDDVNESECAELELVPSLVEMPVDAAVASALSVTVPPGSYSSLEAKIRGLRSDGDRGHGSSAFLAAHPELAGVSVIVTGTYDGRSFTYMGDARAELETRFDPPLAVDAAPVNLTVHADVTSWFRTQSGALVDPATANAGGANAGLVADNIRRSFRAFRDDDRDGHDDGDRAHP